MAGETVLRAVHFHGMEDCAKRHDAAKLVELARQLRQSASETDDHAYIELFLSAAEALEARARIMAAASSKSHEARSGGVIDLQKPVRTPISRR